MIRYLIKSSIRKMRIPPPLQKEDKKPKNVYFFPKLRIKLRKFAHPPPKIRFSNFG